MHYKCAPSLRIALYIFSTNYSFSVCVTTVWLSASEIISTWNSFKSLDSHLSLTFFLINKRFSSKPHFQSFSFSIYSVGHWTGSSVKSPVNSVLISLCFLYFLFYLGKYISYFSVAMIKCLDQKWLMEKESLFGCRGRVHIGGGRHVGRELRGHISNSKQQAERTN